MAEIPTKATLLAAQAYCVHGDRTDETWAPCPGCYRTVELLISLAGPILCNAVAKAILAEEKAGPSAIPSGSQVTYWGGLRRGAAIARRAFADTVTPEAVQQLTGEIHEYLEAEHGA
ncbi:hypothetical protein AB0O28_19005 [Microbispora sp. NPDC088329]|uniref:hypothetical protein n=1 Tax=Microbispora sp. NPDC088329 TaxID=3154869 RepID=UPI003413B10B